VVVGAVVARLTDAERTRLWGPPCTDVDLRTVTLPWGMRARVHRLAETVLIEACNAAARESRWTPKRVDSYACRTIRGSSARSLHSWGLAWDFFATDPGVTPPGGVWKPANTVTPDFAACFERLGFTWGRNFSRQDWPHLELAGPPPMLVQTQTTTTQGDYVKPQPPPPPVQLPGGKMRQIVAVGPLDSSGRGWVQTGIPFDGFEAATVNAVNPEQSGYGNPVVVHAMNWDEKIRLVVMDGKPGSSVGVYVTTSP
jgi:hypothetical protein